MPWSEWITPPPSDAIVFGSKREAVSRELITAVGGVGGDADTLMATALAEAREGFHEPDDGFLLGDYFGSTEGNSGGTATQRGDAQIIQTVHTMKSSIDVETWHDSFPEYMNDLTEGVDYEVIPGMDPAVDEFAYVEYEETENELLGWESNDWDIVFSILRDRYKSPDYADLPVPAAIPLRLAFVDFTPLEDPIGWPANIEDGAPLAPIRSESRPDDLLVLDIAWVVGYSYGLTMEPVDAETVTVDITGLPPRFGLLVQPATMEPLFEVHAVSDVTPVNDGDLGESHLQQIAELVDPSYGNMPRYRFQMPRYRYWIPGRLPLRQRQRDDSLALGSPRQGKKTSRQGSIRQRGYL